MRDETNSQRTGGKKAVTILQLRSICDGGVGTPGETGVETRLTILGLLVSMPCIVHALVV